MGKYIVTGATGHIGNVIVKKLCEKKLPTSVLVLPNENLEAIQGLNVEILVGDVTDRDFIFKIIDSDSIVIHLAGIIDIGLTPPETVYKVK